MEYITTFDFQQGSTSEAYVVKIEYCEDFTGDGLNDIRITVAQSQETNSGTEDIIGIAFDIDAFDPDVGLSIEQITLIQLDDETLSSFTPTVVLGDEQVSDGGPLDPGFNTSGATAEPFDVGIHVSATGAGEGIVQSFSFVLTGTVDLDAEALLEGLDWYIRTQSTDGGEESAKTAGVMPDLPSCGDDPDDPGGPGSGNTPGFWKNHAAIFEGETFMSADTKFEDIFGVDVVGWKKVSGDPTLLEALSAKGGGESALLRAATAAWANATSDDVNYVYDHEETMAIGLTEVFGLDPEAATYEDDLAAAWDEIDDILFMVDSDGNGAISAGEVIAAVQEAYSDTPDYSMTDLATALDAMNNMPSVEVEDFVWT